MSERHAVPALQLESVSVRRGDLSVLRQLDFRAERGDSWVIFGENGAGKSTLVQLITGQLAPTAGGVWVGGMRSDPSLPRRARAEGLRFASLLEQPGLAPDLSALENVSLPLRYHGSTLGVPASQAPRAAREALAALAVYPPDVHSLPDRLSFGVQRRVALARILALEPQIVVLDDPLLGVDSESAELIERLLRRWVREPNVCLLCVTGDRQLGSRIGATPAELRQQGLHWKCAPRHAVHAASETESQLLDAAGDAGMLH